MEKTVMSVPGEGNGSLDERKVPIMKTLARFHECDVQTLSNRVDESDTDLHDILNEMVSREEVVATTLTGQREVFTLTLKGWGEYLRVLGSIYELTE